MKRAGSGATRDQAHRRRSGAPTLAERPRRRLALLGALGIAAAAFLSLLLVGHLPSRAAVPSRGASGAIGLAEPASGSPSSAISGPSADQSPQTDSPEPGSTAPPSAPVPTPTPPGAANESNLNLYAHDGVGMFSPVVAGVPARVYVPDEASGTVIVIDPATYRIVGRFAVGPKPEHITPDWDLRRLFVEVAFGGHLAVIDPRTGHVVGRHVVPGPYNLYFSLDGRKAIVVLDSRLAGSATGYGGPRQLYFYDRRTWRLLKALRIPWAGADHLDFSADGRYFLMSAEYSGYLVKVDVARMAVVGAMWVGGLPIDVRLAPDGKDFYVANQGTGGVAIIDPVRMRQVGFLRTGRGAHGEAISRDAKRLYVTNRLAGTLSVIDFARRRVVATWRIGGSPDMIAVSPDGTKLWISNRFNGSVSVIDARTGRVIVRIHTGGRPHGLAFFPEPGRLSLGHNGIYR